MPRNHSKAFLSGALALAAVALAGCEQPPPPAPAGLQQASAPPELHVNRKTDAHDLQLDASGAPSALERQRLDAFIADLAGNRPDALHVTISGSRPEAQMQGVVRMLVEDGLDPKKIDLAPPSDAAASGPVSVAVDRYLVTPPTCAPWNAEASAGMDNSATRPDFGCSNLKNLGGMVADPHDLVSGSSSPYTDGATAAAVQRYYEDKLKRLPPLEGISTFSTSGSSGTGAP